MVFTWLDDAFVPAGRLRFEQSGRQARSVFRYGQRYLQRHNALALDPVQLPLGPDDIDTPEGFDMFNGIRDAGPDRWGRYLLDKKFAHALNELEYIAATGPDRVGALGFGATPDATPDLPGETPRLDLETSTRAIAAATAGEDSAALAALLAYGPSLGGARPKITVTWNGRPYIAKFSLGLDARDEPAIEYATMSLAAACGLRVPPIDKTTALGRSVYLIERFDRQLTNGREIPLCFMSGLTATGLHESDFAEWSYQRLAEAITRYSADPQADRDELFKRLLFNILVFNNDDHMRNHGFVRDGAGGWRLSPLYDVVPSTIHAETYMLSLAVGIHGKRASVANALSAAPTFRLAHARAAALADDMAKGVSRWREHFLACGVTERDLVAVANAFRHKG